ncbi:MAG: hypothetical protein Q8Q40_14685 [Methylococcaceae bacterium]|nr:hypothetical protein [Methylococcaceae bacterium]MDP3905204.1 hypothetical protein [Methylococcaceae bacterium]
MFRLFMLLMIVAGLSSCTQAQRFALLQNAKMDECAMKRMSETKISGEQGYLQAHHECHQIVNVQKIMALDLVRSPESERKMRTDPLEEYALCWEFVKGLYIDEHYPDMKLPERNKRHGISDLEGQKQLEERNSKATVLPGKLGQLNDKELIEINGLMAKSSVIMQKTLCRPWHYQELESILGKEAHRRYPHGLGGNLAGGYQ